jgi:hypothetical protein
MLVLLPWQYGAMMFAALEIVDGQPPRVGAACKASGRRLGALCLSGFLTILAGTAALVALIFPGIYVWLGFYFAMTVIMAGERRGEHIRAVPAMRRSWALTRGLRGRLFGVFLVWGLLQLVISFAIGGVLGLLGIDGAPRELTKQLSAMFISPCYGLSLALLFAEARAHQEGHDLLRQAEQLAETAAPAGGVPAV